MYLRFKHIKDEDHLMAAIKSLDEKIKLLTENIGLVLQLDDDEAEIMNLIYGEDKATGDQDALDARWDREF